MKEYISNSIEETFEIAKEIARKVSIPSVILLEGDLGAGKTHFVKGFAKALGYNDIVNSPTFTIMNEYIGGKSPIYHFDMYRLSSMDEAVSLGFMQYFDLDELDGISLVEWPNNVEGIFPNKIVKIDILKTDKENQRRIVLQ